MRRILHLVFFHHKRFAKLFDGSLPDRLLYVQIHILNMGLVENTLTGNLILTVMLAFAEYERGMIVERTQTGKAVARQNPNFREGRPKKYTAIQIKHAMELLDSGKSYKQVEAMTGNSKSTLIRAKRV